MDKVGRLQHIYELLLKERETRKSKALHYIWEKYARPNQKEPKGPWRTWLIMAGRGFGKTRTGAETLRKWVKSGKYRRLALIGETQAEIRRVMVEGPSGLLAVHPPKERPKYINSLGQITWPNGALATCYSAHAYEHLRGPQFDGAWIDEFAKFREGQNVWDQLMFSLRIGETPRVIITTTPRPTSWIKNLLKDASVYVTKGSTFDNAKNLAPSFLHHLKERYANSWLGRQEIYADIVEEREGALWTPALLEKAITDYQETSLKRIVIAVDPAVSHGAQSDETGIIAAGVTVDGQGVVLDDRSLKGSPSQWIQTAIGLYHELKADRIVAEVNMGGDLVEQLLRTYDPSVSYKAVRARRGKIIRAEPIMALYEKGKIWHAKRLPSLESQLCSYIPGVSQKSPDRLDALVWALSELIFSSPKKAQVWLN